MATATADPLNPQLLHLLHLASPALPVGAFHFSQALEYAVEAKWVHDEASALDWIAGLAGNALGRLDLPVMARMHAAWLRDDVASVQRWNALLIAARETEELRAEDRHTGKALQKILAGLGVQSPDIKAPAYATMFALACARWSVPAADGLHAYAWSWAENQVLAAIKLVPLGQSAGQRMLHQLIPKLTALGAAALAMDDDDIGVCAVMHGMASARHELQYTRLFRS